MELAVPLYRQQIDAADELYNSAANWRSIDDALSALAIAMPGFGPQATLVKATAVNSLYSTRIWAVAPVAKHVEGVLARADLPAAGPELVVGIAAVPAPPGARARRVLSFASKFAHFFIDSSRFPIYDQYARRMLLNHLGPTARIPEKGQTYERFVAAFLALAEQVDQISDTRQLDRYLWIIGQYLDWSRRPQVTVNSELRAIFMAGPPALEVAAGSWYRPVE